MNSLTYDIKKDLKNLLVPEVEPEEDELEAIREKLSMLSLEEKQLTGDLIVII